MPFLPRISPKVISVGYTLPPKVVPYISEKYDSFLDLLGDAMMSPARRTTERIWYLLEDWCCLLTLDTGFLEIECKKGWWLDWESIPGLAEGVESRDDRQGLIGGTIHDAFFAVQFPFFDTANSVFYQVMRLEGTPRFRSWYKWACVQSPAGRRAWDKCSPPVISDYEKYWISVKEVPVVSEKFRPLLGKKNAHC